MIRADDAWRGRWLRYALLALAFSALWLAISLFSSVSSASADEAKPSSLLGTLGSVVGGVSQTSSTPGDALGDVVATVIEPVDAVVEPVLAPVAAVVDPVVETVVPAPVGGLVEAVVPAGVGELTKPLVDIVDQVAGSLPIVGGIVGDDTVGSVVSPVTGIVDDALGTIVGSPIDLPGGDSGSTPQLPGESPAPGASLDPAATAAPIPVVAGVSTSSAGGVDLVGAPLSGAIGSATSPASPVGSPGDAPPALAPPGSGSTGTGASGSGPGGSSASSDTAFAALELDARASLVLHSVDDALPSSPVYDTDSTPD
ncbi:hypothetical protein [Agromyces neolithicus]|uniref:Uncharacterized protein n=1 Tax=Agromyces neolithicus TaxID=269420 RepID=A0ABN2LR77_9MICO